MRIQAGWNFRKGQALRRALPAFERDALCCSRRKMLTPKCPLRDFRVSARGNSTKNRLCRFKGSLSGRKLAEFQEDFGSPGTGRKYCYISGLAWLCWQSKANPSLPANLRNAGRFRQIAGKGPPHPCRKPQHLRALDSPLPNLTSRENLFHSREASRANEVFGTARREREMRQPAQAVRPFCLPTSASLWLSHQYALLMLGKASIIDRLIPDLEGAEPSLRLGNCGLRGPSSASTSANWLRWLVFRCRRFNEWKRATASSAAMSIR